MSKKRKQVQKVKNWYEQTNKIVFDTLQQGLSQEKKEISQDAQKERELRVLVETENRQIRERKLNERKKTLLHNLENIKKQLHNNSLELQRKESSLKEALKTNQRLQKNISLDQTKKKQLETELEQKIGLLLKKEQEELHQLKTKEEVLKRKITILQNEMGSLEQQTKEARQAIIGKLGKKDGAEIKSAVSPVNSLFQQILANGRQQISLSEHRLQELSSAEKAEKNKLQQNVKKIGEEIFRLEQQKQQLMESVAKKNRSVVNFRLLEQKKNEQEKIINEQDERLLLLLKTITHGKEERKEFAKKISEDLSSIFLHKKLKKEEESQAQKELSHLKRNYDEKLILASAKKEEFDKNIHSLEEKKAVIWTVLEKDKVNLNRIKEELLELEEKLKQRELDTSKERDLLQEIDSLRCEKRMEEEKLSKIGGLVKKVKELALTQPGILINIKKEKSSLEETIKQKETEISKKNKIVQALHPLLANFKKEFAAKQKQINHLQQKWLEQRKRHQDLLSKINHSLSELQMELVRWAGSLDSLEYEKKQKIMEHGSALTKKIVEINKVISLKKDEFSQHQNDAKAIQKHFGLWEQKRLQLTQSLLQNRKLFSNYEHALYVEKEKRKVIAEEENILQKLIAKIREEKKLQENMKGTTAKHQQELERKQVILKEELSALIKKLRKKIKSKGRRKLKELEKLLVQEQREHLRFSLKLKRERMKIAQEKNLEEKKLGQKADLSKEIELLKQQKKEKFSKVPLLKERLNKLAVLLPQLEERAEHTEEEEKRIEHKIALHQAHLKELRGVNREKEQHLKEKAVLRQEVQQLHAALGQKVHQAVKVRKCALAPRESKELKILLKRMDNLLGKLPGKEITKFSKSKDFGVYKKVMNKYGVK